MYAVVVILLAVASFFFSVCIEFMHANAAKIAKNIQSLTVLESSLSPFKKEEKVIKLKFTNFFGVPSRCR